MNNGISANEIIQVKWTGSEKGTENPDSRGKRVSD